MWSWQRGFCLDVTATWNLPGGRRYRNFHFVGDPTVTLPLSQLGKKVCCISLPQPLFTRAEWAMAMSSQTDLRMPIPGLSDFWVGLWPRIPCCWPHLTDGICQNARPELAKPFGHSVLDHPAVCTEANFYIQVKHSKVAFLLIWRCFSFVPSFSLGPVALWCWVLVSPFEFSPFPIAFSPGIQNWLIVPNLFRTRLSVRELFPYWIPKVGVGNTTFLSVPHCYPENSVFQKRGVEILCKFSFSKTTWFPVSSCVIQAMQEELSGLIQLQEL